MSDFLDSSQSRQEKVNFQPVSFGESNHADTRNPIYNMYEQRLKFPKGAVPGRAARSLLIFALVLASLVVGGVAEGQDKNLLWKISDDKNSVFLLGSIHYLRKENYPLNKAILEAFDGSKSLVLEIDLNKTAAEAAQRLTLEKAAYRDGTTLAQSVAPETYRLAAQRANELGIDMRIMNPMKPWFVALTLVAIKLQSLGLEANAGVDRYLAQRAKTNGKATGGLETFEFQIGLLDQLPKTEQELMLRETVRELDLLDKNIDEIVQSWVKGDVELLAKLLLVGMKEYPEVYQKIIVDRNRRWLPEIEKLIHGGSGAMLVVGAAHLVGQDGLIEMLKAKGYSVEQK